MKNLLMWFVFIGITAALFFSFMVASLITTDAVTDKPPFLADVKEIAASEKYVYMLDSTFHNICKYDIDGNFICCISFGETGRSRIFCEPIGEPVELAAVIPCNNCSTAVFSSSFDRLEIGVGSITHGS